MRAYIKRIATGPQMSRDLTFDQARDGMGLILSQSVPDVQAAVFLVALRMKRESDAENFGVLTALREATCHAEAHIPELADLADPYDGFSRCLPVSPFLPALLSACGLPTVSHGCHQVGPKFGVTHRQILAVAGVPVDYTPQQAALRLSDPDIGWAYTDQSLFCPALHRLTELRRLMVKRPCLSTLEKLCGPVRAAKNHLIVGFVHSDYERLLPEAARHAGYDSAVVVRGVEGGVVAPLNRVAETRLYVEGSAVHSLTIDPKEAGVTASIRAIPSPVHLSERDDLDAVTGSARQTSDLATAAAEMGLAAMSGAPGPAREGLVYAAASILYALGRFNTLREAAARVYGALDSGEALARFQAGVPI